jgi:hypothetical protein
MKIVVLENNKTESDILKINFLGKVDELELAHEDYIKRKNEIINVLRMVFQI